MSKTVIAILGVCIFIVGCSNEPGGLSLNSQAVDITTLSAEDQAYVQDLRESIVASEPTGPLSELGIDSECSINLELNAIGVETLRDEGITADNLGAEYQRVFEENVDADENFEAQVNSCVNETVAVESLVELSGGDAVRPLIECLVEENGGIREMLLQSFSAEADSTAISDAIANSECRI